MAGFIFGVGDASFALLLFALCMLVATAVYAIASKQLSSRFASTKIRHAG